MTTDIKDLVRRLRGAEESNYYMDLEAADALEAVARERDEARAYADKINDEMGAHALEWQTTAENALRQLAEAVEVVKRVDTMMRLDLSKMLVWGDDYNQAVKDVADRVTRFLTSLTEKPAAAIRESK